MIQSKLIKEWQLAAKDLEFTIVAPFSLQLPSGRKVEADLLVKEFGLPKGMIIVKKYEAVAPFEDEIIDIGYGYSVISEPRDNEIYNRNDFIELLNDWGWSGDTAKRPPWIKK